ncbi:MAG: sensor histidine kinase [Bryobacteraceae bacterium]
MGQIPGEEWELVTGDDPQAGPEPDVCIWDVQPGMAVPEKLSGQRNLFLIERKEIGAFAKNNLPIAPLGILLKPVTHSALKVFVELAVKREADAVANWCALQAAQDEMLQCLLQTNLRLQEYDRDRTNFLVRAVHDFRAPLTAIGGYCGLLLEEMLGPLNSEQKEVLRRVQHSVRRLGRMANAMFELSAGQNIKRRPQFRRADLDETMDQALHEVGPFSEEKQISITVDLDRPLEPLLFEPSQIEQVLVNLLDNACKFTPKCGYINISGYSYFWDRRCHNVSGASVAMERRRRTSQAPNCYRVDVRDSGPGIPAEHLQSIFEEYTSYAGAQDRSGGGLGLAICKAIMEEHHGRMWAESGSAGAVFSFVLPFRNPEPIPARADGVSGELAIVV